MSTDSEPLPPDRNCSRCGQPVSPGELLQFDHQFICGRCKPLYLQQLREGVPTEPEATLRYAGFWIRGAATFIDFAILYPAGIAIRLAGGQGWPRASGFTGSTESTAADWLLLAAEAVVDMIYYTVLTGRYGGTVGKLLLRLRVVTADGHRVSLARAFGRSLAYYVSLLPCMFGFIMAAFDSQKRTLHDRLCGTRVIHRRKGASTS